MVSIAKMVCLPSVLNWDNSCFVLSNVLENGLSKIEVLLGRITPASSIISLSKVWWTEVSCSDDNGAW